MAGVSDCDLTSSPSFYELLAGRLQSADLSSFSLFLTSSGATDLTSSNLPSIVLFFNVMSLFVVFFTPWVDGFLGAPNTCLILCFALKSVIILLLNYLPLSECKVVGNLNIQHTDSRLLATS